MRFTPAGKVIILVLTICAAIGAYRVISQNNLIARLIPQAATKDAVIPNSAPLPEGLSNATGAMPVGPITLPGTNPSNVHSDEIRLLGYAWNAQQGLLLANGGSSTTSGSLMEKNNVRLRWIRQDDNGKMQEALVAFATSLKGGDPNPSDGAHFVTIMGDGGAAFLAGLNPTLAKLGPEYQAKIVGAIGYSRGEDKFMGPAEWKSNPAMSRGGVVAGVLRDGDWNIAQKWLADNGLKTNPDEKTYDPNALNWVGANDYIDAAEKYVAGYSEDRPVVVNGKRTGETKHIVVQGVVTWTPGDVTIAHKKGGIVSIVSTHEYTSQMPCVIIGIDKWCRANRTAVEGVISATADAGAQIKSSPEARHRAAQIAADAFQEPGSDAAYWERYFVGVREKDVTGETVDLGGSSVNDIGDMVMSMGLAPGSSNLVAATYTVFGDVVKAQYPELIGNYGSADSVIDTSYVQAVANRMPSRTDRAVAAVVPHFDADRQVKTIVSRRNWRIQFQFGTAQVLPESKPVLDQMLRDMLVAGGTIVELHGHTDNIGSHASSVNLSGARAKAVKNYLESHSPANFPQGRIRVFGDAEANPIASNATGDGRAKNRRVEVILGTSAN